MKSQNQLSSKSPNHKERCDITQEGHRICTGRIIDNVNSMFDNLIAALDYHSQQVEEFADAHSANLSSLLRVVHARVVNLDVLILRLDKAVNRQHLAHVRWRRLADDQQVYHVV